MGAIEAFLWGGLAASSLVLGAILDLRAHLSSRAVGMLLAFGAGTLLSAVAYELVPSERGFPLGVAVSFVLGALVFYWVDAIVDRMGGANRKNIGAAVTLEEPAGSGSAIAIGTLLDGIPESIVLGIGLAMGGSVSVAFLVAVFVSNLPEAIGGSDALRAAGRSPAWILRLWTSILVASALAAAGGYLLSSSFSVGGELVQAFAAGAMITMVSDTMLPEAFAKGGKQAGLHDRAGVHDRGRALRAGIGRVWDGPLQDGCVRVARAAAAASTGGAAIRVVDGPLGNPDNLTRNYRAPGERPIGSRHATRGPRIE